MSKKFESVKWVLRDASIKEPSGKIVFDQKDVEAPEDWSQSAINVVASKYFRGHVGSDNRETSVKGMILRVSNWIFQKSISDGLFAGSETSRMIFYDRLCELIVEQRMAFNSPVWFNVGAEDHPQTSACFINSVEDSLESIMTLAATEVRLFKGGSGSGVNLSKLRATCEELSGSGYSSGPVSFMRGLDAFAGTIKSGGRTRRAAKLVCLDINHPDIMEFIQCKEKEEKKAWALIDAGYDGNYNGEAYSTISFQNANNSIRVTDEFMEAAKAGASYPLIRRTDGKVTKEINARDVLMAAAQSAYVCGDPGIQFDTTINKWHTVPNSGRINASNPCQPAFASVLTPSGIKTLGDVGIGDLIWTGSRWSSIKRKIHTGTKEVFEYRTTAGAFVGTKEHKVFQFGERVEADDAESIDTSVGSVNCSDSFDNQAVMDGLVIGDGQSIYANYGANEYVVLHIGQNDQDYFASHVAPMISSFYNKGVWKIQTTINASELPKTYERKVPDRFFCGDTLTVRSFLRGLYSANGSMVGTRVTLKASSFTVIDRVQQMLSSLGIRSYYTTSREHANEFRNGTYVCKESYDLNIIADRGLFASLIGFIQRYKQDRLIEACKRPTKPSKQKTTYEIVSKTSLGNHDVWDIEVEADEHSYWTGGLRVSNCSEYMFLDDTACNLASLNLVKFLGKDNVFDIEAFQYAVSSTIIAQEILVGNSKYPTPSIEANSHKFRPLGIGYANLGAALMRMGLPYDSDEARTFAKWVTAIMTGTGYYQSARIAKEIGACEGFKENREPFLRVIDQHIEALGSVRSSELTKFHGLELCARSVWRQARELGDMHGYRNCQISVLAPTGTIGFMMDCDTTGIEPELALVKYKLLAGGGTMKIVNQSVPTVLANLKYSEDQIARIVEHISETGTIEGAPGLKSAHLPIFDCALKPAKGTRVIWPHGHIRMMAAAQPFLSGAISKTVNVPESYSAEDIYKIYVDAHEMGLKSVAVYRDGSKRSQPLNVKEDKQAKKEVSFSKIAAIAESVKPARTRLPDERTAVVHRFSIGGFDGYATLGLYENGSPGELFINMSKEGSTVSGLMDAFAIAISIGLQYGVPVADLVQKFKDTRFEPSGYTSNKEIPIAKSIIDYIFRWIEIVQSRSGKSSSPASVSSSPASVSSSPPCPSCGSLTVRSGSCYACPSCGTTTGCS